MPELPAAAVRFNVLGVLEAWRDGGRITIPAGRQRQLLCLLMIERGAVVSADRVIDELWEGAPPATAVKAVHVSVSSIRRALGPDRALLETHERGYRLALPPGSLDIDRFAELVERGRGELARGWWSQPRPRCPRRWRFGAASRLPTSPATASRAPRSRA